MTPTANFFKTLNFTNSTSVIVVIYSSNFVTFAIFALMDFWSLKVYKTT